MALTALTLFPTSEVSMLTVPDYPRIYPRYLILNFHAMVAERFQKVAEGAIFLLLYN